MAFLSLLAAVIIFLIGALAPMFKWNLGDWNPLYWGLMFFSLSFLIPGFATFRSFTRRP